jgi:hypothetical protein
MDAQHLHFLFFFIDLETFQCLNKYFFKKNTINFFKKPLKINIP